jgi:hypothetical protein
MKQIYIQKNNFYILIPSRYFIIIIIIIINTLFKLLKIPSAMLLVLTGEQ